MFIMHVEDPPGTIVKIFTGARPPDLFYTHIKKGKIPASVNGFNDPGV